MGPGSSPHTRGLPRVGGTLRERIRIIPAHAGFTLSKKAEPVEPGDHPRTRGVYVGPRSSRVHTQRIIPAHAGFTSPQLPTRSGPRDHPRTRGVYLPSPSSQVTYEGSSPHTRGLPGDGGGGLTGKGIIPAHAGFT